MKALNKFYVMPAWFEEIGKLLSCFFSQQSDIFPLQKTGKMKKRMKKIETIVCY